MNIPVNRNNYKNNLAIFLIFNIISSSFFTLSFGKASSSPSHPSNSPPQKETPPSSLKNSNNINTTSSFLQRGPNNVWGSSYSIHSPNKIFTSSFPHNSNNHRGMYSLRKPDTTRNTSPHNYCIAIRGNGELMPAHWGALAQTVENFGVPKGMAGGSSGSISTFLMESFLMNPLLAEESIQKNFSNLGARTSLVSHTPLVSHTSPDAPSIQSFPESFPPSSSFPLSSNDIAKIKAAYLAFMIKSMQGFVSFYTNQPQFQQVFTTLNMLTNLDSKQESFITRFSKFIIKNSNPFVARKTWNDLSKFITDAKNSRVFYGPQVERFYNAFMELDHQNQGKLLKTLIDSKLDLSDLKFNNLNKEENKKVIAFAAEYAKLKEGLSVFGSFNAKDDKPLFYRGGIINFKELANIFGFIADFYSLQKASPTSMASFQSLLNDCALHTSGLRWEEMTQKCENTKLFHQALNSYLEDRKNQRDQDPSSAKSVRLSQHVGQFYPSKEGQYLPAFISTSVVTDTSNTMDSPQSESVVAKLLAEQGAYNKKTPQELNDVEYRKSLETPPIQGSNLKFGYWGNVNDLNRIQKFMHDNENNSDWSALVKNKKERFLSLGTATWHEVLSLSPAEPGLSSMLPFTTADGKRHLSFGGWSDLLPIPILKFMGCENVVYVTRQGGESLFAQGIAKRLLKFTELDWSDLDPSNTTPGNQTHLYNNRGRNTKNTPSPSILNGAWSKMFNIANPKSSFNLSLNAADAVVCTHWNAFNITKDYSLLIKEAYEAPIYNPSRLDFLGLKSNNTLITASDNALDSTLLQGFEVPHYSGCIPLPN